MLSRCSWIRSRLRSYRHAITASKHQNQLERMTTVSLPSANRRLQSCPRHYKRPIGQVRVHVEKDLGILSDLLDDAPNYRSDSAAHRPLWHQLIAPPINAFANRWQPRLHSGERIRITPAKRSKTLKSPVFILVILAVSSGTR